MTGAHSLELLLGALPDQTTPLAELHELEGACKRLGLDATFDVAYVGA